MREPGEEDSQNEIPASANELAGARDELIGVVTLEAATAAGVLSAAVLLAPGSAGAAWSTGRLMDGRFVQVAIYLGRQLRPAARLVDPPFNGPPLPAGAADLPHFPAQGELLL